MADDDIDPILKRAVAETLGEQRQVREHLTALATSRGTTAPEPPLLRDFEEELITAKHDIEELKRAAMESRPSLNVSIFGQRVHVAGIQGGRLIVLVLALALLALAVAIAVAIVERPEVSRPRHVEAPAPHGSVTP